MIIQRQAQLRCAQFCNRFQIHLGSCRFTPVMATQMILDLVIGNSKHPVQKGAITVEGMTGAMDGQQDVLESILQLVVIPQALVDKTPNQRSDIRQQLMVGLAVARLSFAHGFGKLLICW